MSLILLAELYRRSYKEKTETAERKRTGYKNKAQERGTGERRIREIERGYRSKGSKYRQSCQVVETATAPLSTGTVLWSMIGGGSELARSPHRSIIKRGARAKGRWFCDAVSDVIDWPVCSVAPSAFHRMHSNLVRNTFDDTRSIKRCIKPQKTYHHPTSLAHFLVAHMDRWELLAGEENA